MNYKSAFVKLIAIKNLKIRKTSGAYCIRTSIISLIIDLLGNGVAF